jgi:tetratricopeptide (TPR) repeat protein
MAYEGVEEEDEALLRTGAAAIAGDAWERIGLQEKKRRRGAWIWISAAASIVLLVTVGLIFLRGPSDATMEQVAGQYYKQPVAPSLADKGDVDSAGFKTDLDAADKPNREGFVADAQPVEDMEEASDDVHSEFRDHPMAEKEAKEESDFNSITAPDPASSKPGASKGITLADASAPNRQAQDGPKTLNQALKNTPQPKAPADMRPVASGKDAVKSAPIPATDMKSKSGDIVNIDSENEFDDFVAASEDESLADVDGNAAAFEAPEIATTEVTSFKKLETQKIEPRKNNNRDPGRNKKTMSSNDQSLDKTVTLSRANQEAPAQQEQRDEPGKASGGATVVTGSTTISDPYAEGMESYRRGQYAQSATLLRKASASSPANLQAHYYAAASFMNIDQPQAAIYHLDRILAVPGNSLYADAEWYKALAYLKLKDRKNAKSLLEKIAGGSGPHASEAKNALKDL